MCIRDSIRDSIHIKNNHTIANLIDFINKVKNVKLPPNYKIASFDIVKLYTNIPVRDTLQILRNNLFESNKLNAQMIEELMGLLEVILEQNYFTFNDQCYSQSDGLATVSYTHLDVYKRQHYMY